MKKIILTAVALLAFGFANAQEGEKSANGGFSKGDVFVTGAVTFGSTNDKDFDVKTNGFEIAPQVGYFLTENIAIGGKLGFASYKEEMNPIEAKWWLTTAKKEYYFPNDRKITYEAQNV